MIASIERDRQRLEVDRVRDLGIGHDRRRIRVDEDDPVAFLAQRAARLDSGVVELGGLTDDDRTGADDEDGTPGHSSVDWRANRRFPAPLARLIRTVERRRLFADAHEVHFVRIPTHDERGIDAETALAAVAEIVGAGDARCNRAGLRDKRAAARRWRSDRPCAARRSRSWPDPRPCRSGSLAACCWPSCRPRRSPSPANPCAPRRRRNRSPWNKTYFGVNAA